MRKVHVADADPIPNRPARAVTDVAGAVDASKLGIRYYELDPGDSVGRTYHKHDDQEELFYVESGTVTFDTTDGPVPVESGEVVRFAPGEYQRGTNDGDEPATVLGLGAPAGSTEVTRMRHCDECGGRRTVTFVEEGSAVAAVCDECGGETGRW
jgi:uncharacterized cupin superfamily protein